MEDDDDVVLVAFLVVVEHEVVHDVLKKKTKNHKNKTLKEIKEGIDDDDVFVMLNVMCFLKRCI